VSQIVAGAPADVFASADTANMDKLTRAGLQAQAPAVFATNRLAVIVGKGNPKDVTGVADLARTDVKVVLCAQGVPCGGYAQQVLAAAGVEVRPVSLEQNVKGVVTKVTAGEADAGIVYVTDIAAAGGNAEEVPIPSGANVVAQYPAAVVKSTKHPEVAYGFVEFLSSPAGQAVLATYGFGRP
jgi:molybdate transport system substrate-binding protein